MGVIEGLKYVKSRNDDARDGNEKVEEAQDGRVHHKEVKQFVIALTDAVIRPWA